MSETEYPEHADPHHILQHAMNELTRMERVDGLIIAFTGKDTDKETLSQIFYHGNKWTCMGACDEVKSFLMEIGEDE